MTFRYLLLALCALGPSLLAELGAPQIQRARAATVLIATRTFGSGFCITDDGYVLTACHILGGMQDQVRVVLHPGEPEQRIVQADVLQSDKKADLALLRLVDVQGALDYIELGNTEGLVEEAELTVLACPVGMSRSVSEDTYPSVTIDTGKVTSLRRRARVTLEEFQMDVWMDLMAPGGPVLDSDGKAVGVALRRLPRTNMGLAVSVDKGRALLAMPELVVSPVPAVPWDQRFAPVTLQIEARSRVPSAGRVECRASLAVGGIGRELTVTETVAGKEWTATGPLLVGPTPDGLVKVQVETGNATVIAAIPNCKVAAVAEGLPEPYEWDLRELAEVVPGSSVTCQAGFSLSRENLRFTGLEPFKVCIAGQDVTVPVGKLKSLRVLDKQVMVGAVAYHVWLRIDGKQWVSAKGTIPLQTSRWRVAHAAKASPEVAATVISPPPPTKDRTVPEEPVPEKGADGICRVKLPAPYTDCVQAGSGRYLLLVMPTLRRMAVLDLADRTIAGYVPLPEPGAIVAGGRDCLFVGLPTSGVLERWSLVPPQRKASQPLPVEGTLRGLGMGADSDGPLLVLTWSREHGQKLSLIDGESMVPLEVEVVPDARATPRRPAAVPGPLPSIEAAACGMVFGISVPDSSRRVQDLYVLADGRLKGTHTSADLGYALPGPNGEFIHTGKMGVCGTNLVHAIGFPTGIWCSAPSSQPAYYLGMAKPSSRPRPESPVDLSVYARGLPAPVLTVPVDRQFVDPRLAAGTDSSSFGKCFHLVPQLGLLAILPPGRGFVAIQNIDIERALLELDAAYLFVESTLPTSARKGTTFRYQIVARTSARSLTYKLDSGPEGMTISPTGELVWDVPATVKAIGGIIVTLVTDDGQKLFHAFNLKLVP